MIAWTFSERVDLFLELAEKIEELRLSSTGIDLSVNFSWRVGEQTSSSIGPIDQDDFRSFVAAWRQLVMRSEPTHLPTLLRLCGEHLTHPTLRDVASQIETRLDTVNGNEMTDTFRITFSGPAPSGDESEGVHEYTPWEVADVVMHGSVFHSKDRTKKRILRDLEGEPHFQTAVEHIFRRYIGDVMEVSQMTRLMLLKAKEKDAISDEPVELMPANREEATVPEYAHVHFHGKDWRALKKEFKEAFERLFHEQHGQLPTPDEMASEIGAMITVKPRLGQVDRWDVSRQ